MDNRSELNPRAPDHSFVREYYDRIYYGTTGNRTEIPNHYRRLARRLQPWRGKHLLDVACGTGEWLRAAANCGAVPAGVDISRVALDACGTALPQARLHCGSAEELPFEDGQFDFISCLGALEHFIEPRKSAPANDPGRQTERGFFVARTECGFSAAATGTLLRDRASSRARRSPLARRLANSVPIRRSQSR